MYDIEVLGDGHNHARLSFKDEDKHYHFRITTDDQYVLIHRLAFDLVWCHSYDTTLVKANIDSLKRLITLIENDIKDKS